MNGLFAPLPPMTRPRVPTDGPLLFRRSPVCGRTASGTAKSFSLPKNEIMFPGLLNPPAIRAVNGVLGFADEIFDWRSADGLEIGLILCRKWACTRSRSIVQPCLPDGLLASKAFRDDYRAARPHLIYTRERNPPPENFIAIRPLADFLRHLHSLV